MTYSPPIDTPCPDCGAQVSFYARDPEWGSRTIQWSCGRCVGSFGKDDLRETQACGVKCAGTGPLANDLILSDREVERFGEGLKGEALRLASVYVQVMGALVQLVGGPEAVEELLRAREEKGVETYGHPLRVDVLRPDGAPYEWAQEAIEELGDAVRYLRAAIEQERNERREA